MLEKSLANCGTTLLSSLNISLEESFLLCCVSIFVAYSALRRVVLDLEVGIIDKGTMRCLIKNQGLQSMPHAFKFRPFSLYSNVGLVRTWQIYRPCVIN